MIKKITDKFFFIERGWLNANHFVFNGKDKALIDTGYIKYIKTTLQLITETGLNPADAALIISTHSHSDHIGGNHTIQELSNCEIAMHYIDKHHIDSRDDWSTWWRYYDQDAEFFRVDRSLKDGQTILLDQLKLVVFHTPGHASGQISLYSPEHKFLISSDAIWNGDFGVITPRIEGNISPFLQWETLEKLESLDIEVIYPGHGAPIYDPGNAISKGKKRLDTFLKDPERMGRDQIKKLIIYILLIKPGFTKDGLFDYLLSTHWYKEVIELYFQGCSKAIYEDVMEELQQKGIIKYNNEMLEATLNP